MIFYVIITLIQMFVFFCIYYCFKNDIEDYNHTFDQGNIWTLDNVVIERSKIENITSISTHTLSTEASIRSFIDTATSVDYSISTEVACIQMLIQ